MGTPQIKQVTLLSEVRKHAKTIWYGANTCWWTHRQEHICREGSGLPCDPRGGVLFQTDNIGPFLDSAIEKRDHYGKHKLAAFMAAHSDNCVVESKGRWVSTCFRTWKEYNLLIDAQG